MSIQMKITN